MVPNDLIDGLDNTLFHLLQLAHKPFFQPRQQLCQLTIAGPPLVMLLVALTPQVIYRFSHASLKAEPPPFFFPCCCCFVLFFCWHLLICENTLIQVVKLKRKKEKNSCPR